MSKKNVFMTGWNITFLKLSYKTSETSSSEDKLDDIGHAHKFVRNPFNQKASTSTKAGNSLDFGQSAIAFYFSFLLKSGRSTSWILEIPCASSLSSGVLYPHVTAKWPSVIWDQERTIGVREENITYPGRGSIYPALVLWSHSSKSQAGPRWNYSR